MTWADVLAHWNVIQVDLHERFGIDCDDRGLLRRRPFSWLRLRITGLLDVDSRLRRVLIPN